MEKLNGKQILDLLASAKSDILRIHALEQPQLLKLKKPIEMLRQADDACRDCLPQEVYETKCKPFCLPLSEAMEQVINKRDCENLREVTELAASIIAQLYNNLKDEPCLSTLARKKKIVFLPYKASMWDSLESIWKAAYEDKENCNAYVVPIPYADLNPDGSAAKWHSERDLFPDYVPTLDYKTFDLEALHPDVIFIHNPYDNYNRVTSVDPRFYSSELKKYTDKLVYVPYFVLGEPNNWTEEEEDKIAHFILTPGVLNSNLTIVQSEAMRKVYISVLSRHTNQAKEYWEERISGAGSPKFDKVAESKKEDFKLPEEWESIINGRKTILYNTSISAMLEHSDTYMEKLRSVLETFKKQNDVALWWRPHPLLRATFESMRPSLLAEYDEIVSAYRREGWGIFDDTAELERSVALTDGYYGDWSSVVHLYEATGKPVMEQIFAFDEGHSISNVLDKTDLMSHFIRTQCSINISNSIYFFSDEMNALFRLDKKTMRQEYLCSFSDIPMLSSCLFTKALLYDEKIFFIPFIAKDIYIYSLNTGSINRLVLNDTDDNAYFTVNLINSHTILIFPMIYFKLAYICNLKTLEIIKISLDYGVYDKEFSQRGEMPVFLGGAIQDDKFVANVFKDNRLCIYDIKLNKMIWRKSDNLEKGLNAIESITNKDELLALNSGGDELLYLDIKGNIIKKKKLPVNYTANLYLQNIPMGYSGVRILQDGSILIIPVKGNNLLIFKDEVETKISIDWNEIHLIIEQGRPFSEVLEDNCYIYLLPYHCNTIARIEKTTYDVNYYTYLDLSAEMTHFAGYKFLREAGYNAKLWRLSENSLTLSDYLKILPKHSSIIYGNNHNQNIGETVMTAVKNLV